MNILLLVVIGILIIFGLIGYVKGFIRTIFTLVSYILMIGLVSFLAPHISNFIEKNTSIHSAIQGQCENSIKSQVENRTNDSVVDIPIFEFAGFPLPEKIKNQFAENAGKTTSEIIESTGMYNEMANYIAGYIVNGIAFFITFVLVSIILNILVNTLDVVSKLPVINGINRILGIIAGLIEGLLVVWLLFFVITISSTTELGRQLLMNINQNIFLQILYNNNPIMLLIQTFIKI